MIRTLLATLVLVSVAMPAAAQSSPDAPVPAPSTEGSEPASKGDAALAGTAWQLVEIVSMDDRVDAPDNRSLYTVEFKADGSVQVQADCNRGTGSWTSVSPGQLQFGQIAATQALCLPGSLHDRYIAQFPWVRSYVMKDGHLFMATMADGSIIEFEPLPVPLAATVLGEEIRTNDPGAMQEIVLARLFDRYAAEQGIEVSDEEIDAYVENLKRGMREEGLTAEDDLTPEEAAQVEQMRREMGRSMIRQWKLNRALHEQYGGRVIFQQLGPEPLDAYRQYLEEREAAGDFTIHRESFKEEFWRYFTNDSMHDFYEPGSDDEARALTAAPWLGEDDGSSGVTKSGSDEGVPLAGDDGGPINWAVKVGAGGLNLRSGPSTSSKILATFASGTILDNLGCQRAEGRNWCDVQRFGGGPRGYVAAEYLKPAVAPDGSVPKGPETTSLRAGWGEFDATGKIPCAQYAGQPMTQCDFGVARQSGGFATVVVTRLDGMKRAIFFRRGVPVGADTSEADGYGRFRFEKESDLNLIRVGDERYEIPDAVVMGG